MGNKTSMPMGEILHVGSDVLDGGGVGNEAALRLKFPLPINFGYALQTLIITKISASIGWGLAQPPVLEMFLASNEQIAQNETTELDIPLGLVQLQTSGDPTGNIGHTQTMFLGGGSVNAAIDAFASWGQPYPIQFGYWDSLTQTGTVPVFTMGNSDQDTGAGTIQWYSRWLVYNLEQFSNAGLNWRIPVT